MRATSVVGRHRESLQVKKINELPESCGATLSLRRYTPPHEATLEMEAHTLKCRNASPNNAFLISFGSIRWLLLIFTQLMNTTVLKCTFSHLCWRWSFHASLPSLDLESLFSWTPAVTPQPRMLCSSWLLPRVKTFRACRLARSTGSRLVLHCPRHPAAGWLLMLCPTSCGRGSWSFPHH